MTDHNENCVGSGDPVPHILHQWLSSFRPWFTAPSWEHLLVLVMGAILSPGKLTVTSCLRITGRAEADNFSLYHQLLNRARWNPRTLASRLLSLVAASLVPDGPIVIGLDDTIERRWGPKIAASGIYRDPVRSSHCQLPLCLARAIERLVNGMLQGSSLSAADRDQLAALLGESLSAIVGGAVGGGEGAAYGAANYQYNYLNDKQRKNGIYRLSCGAVMPDKR
ncbi:transposase [Rhizobium sp. BR 317]|uniref:transposase n=1 Tax=Rhizobium sp. BR 317 TaxID=3040015 RepID=UPI0039BF480C